VLVQMFLIGSTNRKEIFGHHLDPIILALRFAMAP
jgi:hypothetical protein